MSMNTAGTGRCGDLWHSTTTDMWIVTSSPYRERDKHPLKVDNEEDAIAIGKLLQKSSHSGVFITHTTEVHYHLLSDISKEQHPEDSHD